MSFVGDALLGVPMVYKTFHIHNKRFILIKPITTFQDVAVAEDYPGHNRRDAQECVPYKSVEIR